MNASLQFTEKTWTFSPTVSLVPELGLAVAVTAPQKEDGKVDVEMIRERGDTRATT